MPRMPTAPLADLAPASCRICHLGLSVLTTAHPRPLPVEVRRSDDRVWIFAHVCHLRIYSARELVEPEEIERANQAQR